MEIKFSKYHGLGNDFIIVDYQEHIDYHLFAKKVCNRQLGIGADGLIVCKLQPLEMLFYNQDGSRGTMCGNGMRCFGKYLLDKRYIKKSNFLVQTLAGKIKVTINDDRISVNMGKPIFTTKDLKINTNLDVFLNQELLGVRVSSVFIGTIHTVVFVEDLKTVLNNDLGYRICHHPIFAVQTNVNFVEVKDNQNFKVRTYERGVGWTLACGSGACASFIIGKLENKCQDNVFVNFVNGYLQIQEIEDGSILMCGPAVKVASGLYTYLE